MKRASIKIGVMALVIGLFAVSCGGSGSKQQSEAATSEPAKVETKADDYTKQEVFAKLSASDWQKVIKANYDFDLTTPPRCSFKEGQKENINPTYRVDFNVSAENFEAAAKEIQQYLFDQTAKLSPDGNFQMNSSTGEKGEKITELKLHRLTGTLQPELWYFNTPKGSVQLTFGSVEALKFVRVVLVFMGEAK